MIAAVILRESGYDTTAWDIGVLRSLLANLRIASPRGFRPGRIDYVDIEQQGWEYYHNAGFAYLNTSSPQPHYQSQMFVGIENRIGVIRAPTTRRPQSGYCSREDQAF